MRSRFEAFRKADVEWLLASWHPSTRPVVIDLGSNPRWRGLQIVDVVDGTADDLTVLSNSVLPTWQLPATFACSTSGLALSERTVVGTTSTPKLSTFSATQSPSRLAVRSRDSASVGARGRRLRRVGAPDR